MIICINVHLTKSTCYASCPPPNMDFVKGEFKSTLCRKNNIYVYIYNEKKNSVVECYNTFVNIC